MAVDRTPVNHIGFATDQFDRTRALMEEVLGLEAIPSLNTGYGRFRLAWYRDRDGTEYHVSARIPDLAEQLGMDFNPSVHNHVAFEVESLEDAKAELERLGFEYHELTGNGITSRRQIYVLLEDAGQMLELFETIPEVEPSYVPPEETR